MQAHAGSIAHELAQRSCLSKAELFEAILEPFDIGFEEPWPGEEEASAAERTRIRTCNAIWTIADEERDETLSELGA